MRGRRKITVEEDNGNVYETEIYLPNIRSIVGFLNGVWDFTVYDGFFEGKHKLADIDGSIEMYGHSLVLEFKRSRKDLNGGQLKKATRQARYSYTTTIFIFGDTNRPEEYLLFSPNNLKGSGFVKCDVMKLGRLMKAWNEYAKENSLLDSAVEKEDWSLIAKYLKS